MADPTPDGVPAAPTPTDAPTTAATSSTAAAVPQDTTSAAATGGVAGRPHHGERLDALDGLRAVAVLLVVLFHAKVPGFSFGFVGVDIFFVLSGYLITAGLVRGLADGRGPGLRRFWARRVLRLLPPALLVLLVVLVWALRWAPAFRLPDLGADLFATALYVANWRFVQSSGYFADQGVPSPLLHMWSLAVEEQFYLAWPLLVGLVWVLLRRRGPRAVRAGLVTVGGLLTVASAVLLWVLADRGLTDRAYMGTDAKAFEPLLGALAAVTAASPRAAERARRLSGPLGMVGAVVLTLTMPVLGLADGPADLYFHGGAVVVSLASAALVVGLALGRVEGLCDGLALPPVAYLGRISYGVYLWHWPLTCWLLGDGGWSVGTTATIVALSVALAAASYHLVETPLRRGWVRGRLRTPSVLAAGAAVVVAVAAAGSVLGGTPLTPTMTLLVPLSRAEGTKVVLVVGDSVPQRLLPDLSAAARARGLTLVQATAGGCSPLGVEVVIAPGDTTGRPCVDKVPERIATALNTYHPATVVWWSRYELADRYDGTTLLTAGTPQFWAAQERDLRTRVDQLTAGAARLVLVATDRPGVGIASRCTPADCHPFLRRLVDDDALRVRWNGILAQETRDDPRTRLVQIEDVYCHDAAVPCDDRNAAGVTVRADGSHFSDPAMRAKVAATLLDRVLAARR